MINIRKGQFSMKQVLLVDPGRESSRQHRRGDLSGNTEKSDSAIIFITANDLEQDILKGNYVVFHLAAVGWGIGR